MKTTTIRPMPMKKTGRLAVIWLALAGLLLGGCAGKINEVMESWNGRHISEVIQSWGPATRLSPDGKGGTIYIWETYVDFGDGGWDRVRMFYADQDGIIYLWRWQGL